MLSEPERLGLLAACAALLSLVALLTACAVCPACWIHRRCVRRKDRDDLEDGERRCINLRKSFLDGAPPPYHSTALVDFGRKPDSVRSVSSGQSEIDSVTGIPLPPLSENDVLPLDTGDSGLHHRGYVFFTLEYRAEEGPCGQLRLQLNEVGELPCRPYGGPCDVYLLVSLLGKRKAAQQEVRSSVRRRSRQPVFDESVTLPLEGAAWRKGALRLQAWDADRWANDTLLGEAKLALGPLAADLLRQPVDVRLKLQHSKTVRKNGELLLGLCYLPTAERLTVAVLRANHLRGVDLKSDGSAPFVQAMAIFEGRLFERRKTSSQPPSAAPVFNEMLMFDVPAAKLGRLVLLVTLRADRCLGKVVLGPWSRKQALGHWNAMRAAPRRQVLQWHELC